MKYAIQLKVNGITYPVDVDPRERDLRKETEGERESRRNLEPQGRVEAAERGDEGDCGSDERHWVCRGNQPLLRHGSSARALIS